MAIGNAGFAAGDFLVGGGRSQPSAGQYGRNGQHGDWIRSVVRFMFVCSCEKWKT